LSSWYVTPFLYNGLLNFSWVGSGSGADFLWDVNTFFGWLKKRNQFSDVLADSLWFQVTGFFWNFLDDGFLSLVTFFAKRNLGGTSSTDFTGNLLTFGLWAVFLGGCL